jgi:hypothetical protein
MTDRARQVRSSLGMSLAVTLWVTVSSCAVTAQTIRTEPPAVKRVVLYKHGMGYVERQGKVRDTAVLELSFRDDQMKDLLTSFYAVDLSGGRISSVQYETRDPLSRQLQDILITVPEKAALSQFLTQLKGARVTVKASGETIEGRVLGTEPTSEMAPNGQGVRQGFRLVLLTDAGPIRSADVLSISEFSLADPTLRRDLGRLLDLTLEGKHTNRKKLTLTAAGQGEREVRIGYLVEMPIWKASYRLILSQKEKESALLQGWAMAENTTEEDWKDVSLSFVAGNPFSYVMDLYAPLYLKRPQVPVPGLENLAVEWGQVSPPEVGGNLQASGEAGVPAPALSAFKRESGGKARSVFANVAQAMDVMAKPTETPAAGGAGGAMGSAAGTAAQGARVGELFSYSVQDKVTIQRGQAALVPIVSRQVQGRRVIYYKSAFSPRPTNAWVLRNDTDLTFEAGAVTFFEDGTSLGEGILAHTLPPGSQEVLPYAADASVDVAQKSDVSQQPHFKGKLVDGTPPAPRREPLPTSGNPPTRGNHPATIWLNQPVNALFRLSKPEKPLKEVDNHYRFEIGLKPGETRDFPVEEKREVEEAVDLGQADVTRVRFFAAEKYLTQATRTLLTEIGDLMARKASLQRQIAEWQEQTRRLIEEEARLRQNANVASANTPGERELRAKWMNGMAAAADNLAALRGRMDEAASQARQIDEEVARKIREFKAD